eukprot:Hpha_TRINITY_DN32042_c0_g1::TRINITY_DN32042_c0_g1_i1::g.115890::m.115890
MPMDEVDKLLADLDSPLDPGAQPVQPAAAGPPGRVASGNLDSLLEDIGSDAEQQPGGKRKASEGKGQAGGIAFSTYDLPPEPEPEEEINRPRPPARLDALGSRPADQPVGAPLGAPKAAPLASLAPSKPAEPSAPTKEPKEPPAQQKEGLRENAWLRRLQTRGMEPAPRWGHVMGLYREQVYVHGGVGLSGDSLGDLHRFDIGRGEWEAVFVASGESPCPRQEHTGAVLGHEFILVGGRSGTHAPLLGDCHVFDFAEHTWRELQHEGKHPPPGMCGHTMCAHKRRLYIFGGSTQKTAKSRGGKGEGEK